MTARLSVPQVQPAAYQALLGLEKYLAGCPVPKRTLKLIELRASQMNGCAFCVDMHSHDLKADGEPDERLFSVVTWREAPWFTPAERAALALTEQATRLDADGVTDEVWAAAAEHYDEAALAALVTAIAAINAWNRLGVTLRTVPGSLRKQPQPATAPA
jgi:AhpD family alkylhydroperoxidase